MQDGECDKIIINIHPGNQREREREHVRRNDVVENDAESGLLELKILVHDRKGL